MKKPAYNAELLDAAPPSAIECEEALCGVILLQPSILPEMISAGFRQSMLLAAEYRSLAGHLLALHAQQQPIDLVTLRRDHRAALKKILHPDSLHLVANWPWYLAHVREAWAQRQVRLAGEQAIAASANGRAACDSAAAAALMLDEVRADSRGPQIKSVSELVDAARPLPAVVIQGLLRRGETANIIASPKVGKSWLAYQLALSVCAGRDWLGTFSCPAGSVLLIDNELHEETIGSRIKTSADALAIRREEYAGRFDYLDLRGQLLDICQIASLLETRQPGVYDLVILDALYRAWPAGASENDNAEVAGLFNRIDQIAARLHAAWINIHHASKGAQGEKSVVDVGAGAGSQARAADTHIVLRPHEDVGVVVLDAAVRSFPPIEPLALRWSFPVWSPAHDVDTTRLKGRLTQQESRQGDRDKETMACVLGALAAGGLTSRALRSKTGLSREKLARILDQLEAAGRVVSVGVDVRGIARAEYRLRSI